MKQHFWKPSGHPEREKSLPEAPDLRLPIRRTAKRRYVLALLSVLLACGCVAVGNALFSFPPLLFFGIALMVTATYSGFRPALLALALATLLSDFLFVHPAYEFSMNGMVLRISFYYFLGMLISYLTLKRSGANHRGFLLFPF